MFQLTNKINSFIGTNYCDYNFIHFTNKVSCVDLRIASVALVETSLSR